MTPDDFRAARHVLGERWGIFRPLTLDEMARCLKLKGREPGASVRDYERGKTSISGPLEVAISGLMALREPPAWAEIDVPRRDYNDAEKAMIRDGREGAAKVAWHTRTER